MIDNAESSQWGFRQSRIPVSHMEEVLIYDHRAKMYVMLLPSVSCRTYMTLREESVVMEPVVTVAGTWEWERSRKPCSPISESL